MISPRREQQPDGQIEGLLTADGDQDLVGVRDDAAFREHTLDELFDQHLIVGVRIVCGPVADLDDIHGIAYALAPALDGEERRVYQPAYEGIAVPD